MGVCSRCGARTDALHSDHILPLGLGGEDTAENTEALCVACHAAKTREDVRAMRKADRIRKKRAREHDPPQGWYRGIDGRVRKRQ